MAKSALKFKDSVAAYEQLAGQIAARRFVPIYLLMGEESYFIDAIAEQIATTVLGEAERAFMADYEDRRRRWLLGVERELVQPAQLLRLLEDDDRCRC